MYRTRELVLRYKQNFEGLIGKMVSNSLNRNSKSFRFLEIFLPNNRIFSKYELIFMNKINSKPKYSTIKIYERFIEGEQNTSLIPANKPEIVYPDNVLLLGPKFYGDGKYPSVAWWGFYEHIKSKNVKVTWIDIIEKKNDNKFNLANIIDDIFSNELENNILFLDPLAAPEAFSEYTDINQKFFENIVTRNNFRIIGLLGDIWREKDKKQILNAENYFDGFIHTDKISAINYPEKIKKKFFFYPFDAFDTGDFSPDRRKINNFLFSGQVRAADRRYWLRHLIDMSKKYDLRIENYSWYRYSHGNALQQIKFVEKLNSTQYSVSLTQKGKNNWVMTGRSKQSLLSGCTLIHQESPDYRMFDGILTPYVDYLPFTSLNEFREVIKFVSDYPEESKLIGINGSNKYRSVFSEINFWMFCLNLNLN